MAQSSKIEWTHTTWNPVVGCRKVSDGCRFCYAERMAHRLAGMAAEAASRDRTAGRKDLYRGVISKRGRWNGQIRLAHQALDDPLRWRKPRMIFVNSMSDLFHPLVPLAFIEQVADVIRRCPQHTFQILTKRPERLAALSSSLQWPQNAWLGTSIEDDRVQSRLDSLREVPAGLRFLSLEPLLGPLPNLNLDGIGWVICGGESGPHARPIRIEWVRDIREQCAQKAVPFFFKQWGGRNKKQSGRLLDGRLWDEFPER